MPVFIDTGVLIRLISAADPMHRTVRQLFSQLSITQEIAITSTQNIAEFWSVSTRPKSARGGLGLTPAGAALRVQFIERHVVVRPDPQDCYRRWLELVTKYGVSGRQVHDARLVAFMGALGLHRIATFNSTDFARYPSLEVIDLDAAS